MFKAKTIVSTAKKSLDSLPFEALGQQCQSNKDNATHHVEAFVEALGLKKANWVYPQILAAIGKWTPVRTAEGRVSGKATLAKNLSGNPRNVGYYFFCMTNTRFLSRQYEGDNAYYCALVPLILAAFKKFQGIKYSEWDDLQWVMPENLYSAITADIPDYSLEYLIECRKNGIKEGGKAINAYGIYHITGPGTDKNGMECAGLQTLPALAKMMLCQTWCAHPNNRNGYMILDPKSLDNIPEPLVTSEVIVSKKTFDSSPLPWDIEVDTKAVNDLPWDA